MRETKREEDAITIHMYTNSDLSVQDKLHINQKCNRPNPLKNGGAGTQQISSKRKKNNAKKTMLQIMLRDSDISIRHRTGNIVNYLLENNAIEFNSVTLKN